MRDERENVFVGDGVPDVPSAVVPVDGTPVQQPQELSPVEGDQGIEIPLVHQRLGGGDEHQRQHQPGG